MILSGLLLLLKPEIGFLALLGCLLLAGLFKRTCNTTNKLCTLALYIPSLLLVILYKTPLALVYAIPTLWLHMEIKELEEIKYRRKEYNAS